MSSFPWETECLQSSTANLNRSVLNIKFANAIELLGQSQWNCHRHSYKNIKCYSDDTPLIFHNTLHPLFLHKNVAISENLLLMTLLWHFHWDWFYRKRRSLIKCERSIINITLLWLSYLIRNVSKCTMTLPGETRLV